MQLPAWAQWIGLITSGAIALLALGVATRGLQFAVSAWRARRVTEYKSDVCSTVGYTWRIHGPSRAHRRLLELPSPGELRADRRLRHKSAPPPPGSMEFEVQVLLSDANGQLTHHVRYDSARTANDALNGAASAYDLRLGREIADGQEESEQQPRTTAYASDGTYLISVGPAPKPVRMWPFRRWG